MRGRHVSLLVAIGATLLLAACSGVSSEQSAGSVAEDVAVDSVTGAPMGIDDRTQNGTSRSVATEQQIVRTATMAMTVEDVARGVADIHAAVAHDKGQISSEDVQTNGDSRYATITAQIPAADLDSFIAGISSLGTVDSVTITAQDVTTQVVDLAARIAALKASIDRMTVLMSKAQKIDDLLAIETQLSERQGELDSLTAQRTWLGDQVTMSTVTVSLSQVDEISAVEAPGFVSGLRSGWNTLVSFLALAATALGFFLPFLVMLLVVAIPVTIVTVRQSRRGKQHSDDHQETSTETARPDA